MAGWRITWGWGGVAVVAVAAVLTASGICFTGQYNRGSAQQLTLIQNSHGFIEPMTAASNQCGGDGRVVSHKAPRMRWVSMTLGTNLLAAYASEAVPGARSRRSAAQASVAHKGGTRSVGTCGAHPSRRNEIMFGLGLTLSVSHVLLHKPRVLIRSEPHYTRVRSARLPVLVHPTT